MQNMNYYYDFSGQKFGYPLSLSINGFSRSIFSRQSSLEISYVLKGEYEAVTADFSCVLKEREMIVIAPDDIHMICKNPGSKEDGLILTIHVDFDRMSDAMAGDAKNAFRTVICTEEKNRDSYIQLKKKIGELLLILIQEKSNLFQMNSVMMELVLIASSQQDFSVEELPLQSDYHENYMKAIQYIDAHYSEKISLADVANQLSFSLSYTSRLMKRYTGIPFVKYLSYVRIRASLEKLLEGRDSIEQIAAECGMPNSKAYTVAFKELYGILPSVYRKRFQQNMKYIKGQKDQKMELDEEQKKLLYHLIEEPQMLLYETDDLAIRKKNGEIICRIKNGKGSVKVETELDGTLILRISENAV